MNSLYCHLLEHNRYIGFLGIIVILLLAFLASKNRKAVSFGLIARGILMQIAFAFFILKTQIGHTLFEKLAHGFSLLYQFAGEGARFVFGNLAQASAAWGFIFAVQVVSIIIFFGALTSLLFHVGAIQIVVGLISYLVRPILGTSGAETLCAAANSMLGQTESPLLIKQYLTNMTDSEIMVVMVSGFSTISGSLLAVYGSMGVSIIHLLTASVMSIPSAIVISKILLPETEIPQTAAGSNVTMQPQTSNILDALSQGTSDGMHLAANVLAMLISFISIIALANALLTNLCGYSLNQLFGFIFAPIAYLIGVAWQDVSAAGALLGQKLVINEFVAYSSLVNFNLAERSRIILTYALCGFSNFSCIGIQIGGIGALAPQKRATLTRLGLHALLGGTLANFLNAAIASLLL